MQLSRTKIVLRKFISLASRRGRRRARLTVNHPVDFGIAQDDLHVVAGLSERNGFHKFGNFIVIALGFPEGDAIFASVKRRQRIFRRSG